MENPVPTLRSSVVLRPEYFGGFVFNHFLPPQIKMNKISYEIARMCDGEHTYGEIHSHLLAKLDHSGEYVDIMIRKVLRELESNFSLYWRAEKRNKVQEPSLCEKDNIKKKGLCAPLGVIWELTRQCNLRCRHCFSCSGRPEPNELETREVKQALDIFSQAKVFFINFTGGEPLMRTDLFEILEYASTKKISIDLSTNGLLVDPDTIERLKSTNVFQVQISMDGLQETHDRLRGPGAFQRALDSVGLMKSNDLKVVISTTVTRENLNHVPKIIDCAADAGAAMFKTTLFAPLGRGLDNKKDLHLSPEDIQCLAGMMVSKQKEMEGRIEIKTENCFPWLLDDFGPPNSHAVHTENVCCSAGTSSLFIKANGEIVPCPFLGDFVIGNLRHQDFRQIWDTQSLDVFRNLTPKDYNGKCHNCAYLGDKCYGGCRAAARAATGDLYGEDPYCWKQA